MENKNILKTQRDAFTKVLSITCLILGSAYFILYTFLGIWNVTLLISFIVGVFSVGHFVTRKINFNAFRIQTLLGIAIATLIFTQLLGKTSNMHYVFLVGLVFPLIVFNHNKRNQITGFIISNAGLFCLFNFDFAYIQNSVIPKTHLPVVYFIVPYTILALLAIPIKKLYDLTIKLIDNVMNERAELAKVSETISEQKDLLQGIINSSKDDSIYALDKDFKVLNYNTAFANWIQKTQEKQVEVGISYFDLVPKSKGLLYKPLFKRALSGQSFNKKLINKINGEEVHRELNFTPLMHNNNVVGLTVFSRDITDSVKLESTIQEKKVAEKSVQFRTDFLAQMSHEIRTPLNGIVGMADLISQSNNLDEKEKDQLNIIISSGNELMHIINSVLDLSKLEAGQVQLSYSPRKTETLLEHTKNLYNNRAEEKGIYLKTEISEELPAGILIDSVRIHQILNNLTSNAIKFTHKGGVTLKLSPLNKTKEKVDLKFEIKDTGLGIPEKDRVRLFNKYQQIASNIAKKADGAQMGTGLGLTICQELVELMKGKINLESKVGEGSNFFFIIPNLEITQIDERNNDTSTKDTDTSLGKHILIVEDKKVNQKVAQMVLKSIGHTSEVANNGEEAIMLYMENPDDFDLILMDIQMPVMDGLTATAELRRRFSTLPPIIALSANNMEGSDEYCAKHGLDGYLSKPINGKILKEKLADFLNI